ncbi:metal-binding protein [Fictibacillus sp. NPDC058756]|uniref:metal-binding protein n=1 Tax=Fictibacillus sp. NPDC058756 TaxID=3346625 RepID=UPI00368BB98C
MNIKENSLIKNTNQKLFNLMDGNGEFYKSIIPGKFGGNRKSKIYGNLDCPSALHAISKGGYINHRVFFADEKNALAA